ncbi:MAG: hypothetical protein M1831_001317 [Alyxoria varia]|nr:MAG: hypothetical protein M1831_001317 [Alyxoria varia]
MPSSCKDIRAELAACLTTSDCVAVERNTAKDCLRPPLRDTLPTKCQQLQHSYGACRKGWLDMRKRFRGNAPITAVQEMEADQTGQSYQLYAGAPAFSRVETGKDREEGITSSTDKGKEGAEKDAYGGVPREEREDRSKWR